MPPRKKKRKAKTPKTTQRQSQRQSVVVNIGTKSTTSKPRKSSGSGGLPPPSHMHNLAPTFVTAPQIDYTPLLAMMQHHSKPIVAQEPMPVQNAVTPLSSVSTQTQNDARSAQQLAGEAALRRAGKTAGNFQPLPSVAQDHGQISFPTLKEQIPEPVLGQQERKTAMDATYFAQQRQKAMDILRKVRSKPSIPKGPLKERLSMSQEDTPAPEVAVGQPVTIAEPVREPDPYFTKRLNEDEGPSGGGSARAVRAFISAQQKQAQTKTDIKDVIDEKLKSGEPLTQQEMRIAMMPSTQIGKKRAKKLVKQGYEQFQSLL